MHSQKSDTSRLARCAENISAAHARLASATHSPQAPDVPMPLSSPPRLALIACRVLETELAHFLPQASHVVGTEFLDVGLHDRPGFLRTALDAALARAEDDPAVEAVALVYGVCGLGTVGLRPARCPLVI